MKMLIKLVRNEKRRGAIADRPWRDGAEGPLTWNEYHAPAIVFLTEEQCEVLNAEQYVGFLSNQCFKHIFLFSRLGGKRPRASTGGYDFFSFFTTH